MTFVTSRLLYCTSCSRVAFRTPKPPFPFASTRSHAHGTRNHPQNIMAAPPDLPAGWLETQRRIAARVDSSRDAIEPSTLRLVAGADVSFSALDPALCVACLVVCSFPSLEPVAIRHRVMRIDVPYIPGFLAFREADAVLALLDALAREPGSPPVPQLILIDGNGVLHGMGAGVACHVGVRGGVPTIGEQLREWRLRYAFHILWYPVCRGGQDVFQRVRAPQRRRCSSSMPDAPSRPR